MRKERKEVSLSLLKTPELNTRNHPEKQINEIRRSLKKWGQYKNIVIDENNLVLAGNGLVEAMRAEGYKKAWAIVLYDLSENEKKKLMMADNKTAGLGIDNLSNIEALVTELAGDFDIPGFDDDVLASINAASEEISEALGDYGTATEENLEDMDARAGINDEEASGSDVDTAPESENRTVKCPKCGTEIPVD
ncbi:MAG: ParB N-terminal domain-containing protein [Treponema sp.]|nr:ParB N-terminal domain-containing protein [Treponema sp.]